MFFEIFVNFLSVMMTRLTCALLLIGAGLLPLAAQTPGTATGPLLFEGARLIVGDGRPPVEPARPKRPLLERVGMAAIALVMAALFGLVGAAAWVSGEVFLGAMGAIGCFMTLWVGAITLLRG